MPLEDRIAEARELIRTELATGGLSAVTSSFQAECVAVVDMIVREAPEIPVLFLDTGYHFAETYAYRDSITQRLGLRLVNLVPALTAAGQEAEHGLLYQTAPTRCCNLRKVQPLFAGLQDYDTWFTGLRRDQSPTRANLETAEPFKLPTGKVLRKVSPLAHWSAKDVWSYLKQAGLPVLPLYEQGYTSVGCQPCTALPFDPSNPRSGRWAGQQKLECGIHLQGGAHD
jgi:phosphoadenosine phosphosulfate reductase